MGKQAISLHCVSEDPSVLESPGFASWRGSTPQESEGGLEKSQLPLGGLSGEWGQHVTHLVNMSEL